MQIWASSFHHHPPGAAGALYLMLKGFLDEGVEVWGGEEFRVEGGGLPGHFRTNTVQVM